jgi:predicted nucleic acid-binding protein
VSLVVESSVLVAALLDAGPHGQWAERLLTSEPLHVPELVLAETTNIIRRLERQGAIATPDANAAQEDMMLLPIELFGFAPFATRVWELRQNITSYDAWYVALAEAIGCPMATLDGRLARARNAACTFVTYKK